MLRMHRSRSHKHCKIHQGGRIQIVNLIVQEVKVKDLSSNPLEPNQIDPNIGKKQWILNWNFRLCPHSLIKIPREPQRVGKWCLAQSTPTVTVNSQIWAKAKITSRHSMELGVSSKFPNLTENCILTTDLFLTVTILMEVELEDKKTFYSSNKINLDKTKE
jgi:hypothetical protein